MAFEASTRRLFRFAARGPVLGLAALVLLVPLAAEAQPAEPDAAPAVVVPSETPSNETAPSAAQGESETPAAADDRMGMADTELADLPPPAEPAATPTPVPTGPQRIVIVGDNLAVGVSSELKEALSESAKAEVESFAVGSSGLVRDDFHDWPATLRTILEEPTAAIVLLVGANDRQPLRDDKGSHQPNSDDWLRLYTARVEEMVEIAKTAGVPLFWIEMPIMSSGSLTSTLTLTNAIFRDKTEAAGGTFVETWDQFADENGQYSRSGPDFTGTQRRLRTGDGIHFTEAGYDVLAHVIAKPLLQLAALQADPAAEQAEVEAMMLGTVDLPSDPAEPSASPNAAPVSPGSPTVLDGAVPPETLPGPAEDPTVAAVDPSAPATDPGQATAGPAATTDARRSAASVRQVRVGRPFLLTSPQDGEEALTAGNDDLPTLRPATDVAPAARADTAELPEY